MKKYSKKELKDFVDRAYTLERIDIAREFLAKLIFNDKDFYYRLQMDLAEREAELFHHHRYTSSYEGDYGSCCPWNAPGMSAKDFI